jgi:NADPH:quinone reductase-like Zn-dependent oxidoreductase
VSATLLLGAITCGQGFFQKALKLNLPTNPIAENEYVLIYGGSTATGSLACQYVKLAGYNVLTTCTPKHYSWMKSHNITPFNYNEPDCGSQIRAFTNNTFKYAFDTISLANSAKICADTLSTEPGRRYGSLPPL